MSVQLSHMAEEDEAAAGGTEQMLRTCSELTHDQDLP